MNKNITLIDADSLCFLGSKEDTLQQIIEKVEYKINMILEETKADYYVLFVSKGKYFRHNLKDKTEETGTYKSNRRYISQNYNKVIKEYLISQHQAVYYLNAEADDGIIYWMNKKISIHTDEDDILLRGLFYSFTENSSIDNVVDPTPHSDTNLTLASIDKDLLQSIPGKHLNYNKKVAPDVWEMQWIETSKDEAEEFIWKQMLMGDNSDGVKGIPKVGPVKASAILEDEGEPYQNLVLREYINYFGMSQGIYEFQKNYRLLHLLDCDEDWAREVGYIPQLPTFLEVDKEKSIEVNFE